MTLAPWAEVADAVGARTRLVVCSHVVVAQRALRAARRVARSSTCRCCSTARRAPARCRSTSHALGAAAYAAAGQKWLCGPEGTGLLYVSPALRERMRPPAPGYVNLAEPAAGLDAAPWDDARAYDTPALPAASLAHAAARRSTCWAVAGWDSIHAHAAALAARGRRRARRRTAARCSRATARRSSAGVSRTRPPPSSGSPPPASIVRSLPGEDLVRASFGGWNNEDDLDRLLAALPR